MFFCMGCGFQVKGASVYSTLYEFCGRFWFGIQSIYRVTIGGIVGRVHPTLYVRSNYFCVSVLRSVCPMKLSPWSALPARLGPRELDTARQLSSLRNSAPSPLSLSEALQLYISLSPACIKERLVTGHPAPRSSAPAPSPNLAAIRF